MENLKLKMESGKMKVEKQRELNERMAKKDFIWSAALLLGWRRLAKAFTTGEDLIMHFAI
ncbi:MAG: hypothetical protein IKC61_06470 [Clostridia bacterium]|nr:hypothetical protein [Clostridia bacterium]